MNLLYITVGKNIAIHLQAAFSIYSFLGQPGNILTINIITDSPDFYNHLKDHVKIIAIDAKTLQEWKGKHDFFWRVKIKGIEMMCNLYADSAIMYLDTDTFLYGQLENINAFLSNNNAVMHEREMALCEGRSKTEKNMWAQVRNMVFAGIKILPSHYMWNAGVVATPNIKSGEECRLALAICDEMCEKQITRRLIEQFALSVSLSEMYGLKAAKNCIAHYWSNKNDWNEQIFNFFIESYFKAYTFEQNIQLLKNYNFADIPVTKKMRKIKRQMQYFVDKFFPAKNISFIDK